MSKTFPVVSTIFCHHPPPTPQRRAIFSPCDVTLSALVSFAPCQYQQGAAATAEENLAFSLKSVRLLWRVVMTQWVIGLTHAVDTEY